MSSTKQVLRLHIPDSPVDYPVIVDVRVYGPRVISSKMRYLDYPGNEWQEPPTMRVWIEHPCRCDPPDPYCYNYLTDDCEDVCSCEQDEPECYGDCSEKDLSFELTDQMRADLVQALLAPNPDD